MTRDFDQGYWDIPAYERATQKQMWATDMRQNPSPPEKKFWELRAGIGTRVVRQKVLLGYIADFYLPSERAIIEIDGRGHEAPKQADWDERRDYAFIAAGYSVLRIEAGVVFRAPTVAIDVASEFAALIRESRMYGSRGSPLQSWAELVGTEGVRAFVGRGEGVWHYTDDDPDSWHPEKDCSSECKARWSE
jgi:very-short-patch-repair endonuclease